MTQEAIVPSLASLGLLRRTVEQGGTLVAEASMVCKWERVHLTVLILRLLNTCSLVLWAV